jgi:ABC-type Fe3+-hydroxamate transport system substrate-binding protein
LLVSRRAVLAAGAAAIALAERPARASSPGRVVALDWGLAATATNLGRPPISVPAPDWYRRQMVDPALPAGTIDAGLLFTPNMEVIFDLKPDLILITSGLRVAQSSLGRIARTEVVDLAKPGRNALDQARQAAREVAALLEVDAEPVISRFATAVEGAAKAVLAVGDPGPVLLASPIDDRHLTVFQPASLLVATLEAVGLRSASGKSGQEFKIVGIETLDAFSGCTALLIDNGAPGLAARVSRSRLWSAFDFVRDGRIAVLPPILGSGGLASAGRLLGLLPDALKAARRD